MADVASNANDENILYIILYIISWINVWFAEGPLE